MAHKNSVTKSNINVEDFEHVQDAKERDRGYFRIQRERKIRQRAALARVLGIELLICGALSKTSPFGC